ncbi:PREDICTED: protein DETOXIFICATION 48-like [Nicotiana attenuata]|uniref:Protein DETOXIFICATION n=1 Tax=Nicotiana attenuata TaxID=49451 RepID=A0A1J6JV73_NICAT|nr:PREDICTED: protein DETOXIFICATION 48-like [Nicotiana attenuata]OIT21645.1 protein detoxification 48 [Nicotiana attenuata]
MALATSTPLLMDPSIPRLKATHAGDEQEQKHRPTISEVVEEIKLLYSIALPIIAAGLLIYGKSMISMLFMGRLGKEALAGGSLSIGIANITGYSVLSGLAMGMEAISSQACGAKQWPLMGQALQRTILILLFSSIPISLLWLKIEPLLLLCGQDPTISSIASTYLSFCLPDLFFQSLINPLKIYLRTQNVTFPLTLSAAFSLALHVPINYFLIYHLGLGIKGVAMAVAIADFNLLIVLFLYVSLSGVHRKSWQGWSAECLDGWRPILSLAIPSCISLCLEWWWYELMILLSGVLFNAAEAVSTMGILLQATSLAYIFPSALSLAVSTRVGNELGANRPNKAKTSCHVAVLCAIFSSFIAMLFMSTLRNAWGKAFTDDEAILSLTAAAMPVVGLCELGNCPQTTGCGALRGSARPALAVHINLGSFYGVGLPLAIVLGFVMKMGLLGLCMGLLAAQAVCAFLMIFILSRTDWLMQAERARDLIGMDEEDKTEDKTISIKTVC